MKLTLRKAHRLVKDLQSKLSIRLVSKNIHHTASPDEVQDAIALVEALNRASVEQTLDVVEAISDIRAAVQVLNARDVDGDTIDSLLNQKVQVESKMKVLSSFAYPTQVVQAERELDIHRQVQDSAKHAGSGMYRNEVSVSGQNVETHVQFNEQYVALKQEQERISDKLAYINNALHVEIDDKYAELFKTLQVL